MINDKEKIRDKIIELMKMNLESMDMTSALNELKNNVKLKFVKYCKNIDPLDISNKIKVPAAEVIEYVEIFKTNKDVKDLVLLLVNINEPLDEEFERMISKYILESHNELKNYC